MAATEPAAAFQAAPVKPVALLLGLTTVAALDHPAQKSPPFLAGFSGSQSFTYVFGSPTCGRILSGIADRYSPIADILPAVAATCKVRPLVPPQIVEMAYAEYRAKLRKSDAVGIVDPLVQRSIGVAR